MRLKIDRLVVLPLILVLLNIESPEGRLQHSETIASYAVIEPHDPVADTFWEYGAESGVLVPPWDWVGGRPSGTVSDSYVATDTTHIRSGTKSMKIYQPPPTKSDGDRRISNRVYNTKDQYYTSWWMYVDGSWDESDIPDNCWTSLGGWISIFEQSNGKSHWTAGRWYYNWNERYIYYKYLWWHESGGSTWPSADATIQTFTTSYDLRDFKGQWVNFQHYVKWSQTTSGATKAWFNGDLIADKSGIITDPRGYSYWDQQGCNFIINSLPWWNHNLYSTTTSPEQTIWIDDVVLSDKKVPETQRVYT